MMEFKFHQIGFALLLLITMVITINGQFQPEKCCEEYCFVGDRERSQVKRFSTKTPYEFLKVESQRYFQVPNCTPIKFWMLSRHGTRLPSTREIAKLRGLQELRDQIVDNYEVRRSKPDRNPMCQADINLIHQWTWDRNITDQYAAYLTVDGWNEVQSLGTHYRNIFQNLITSIHTPERFVFRHTDTQRTKASYEAFVEGIFGPNAYLHIHTEDIPTKDTLLRPYDFCPGFNDYSQSKNNSESEVSKFTATSAYRNLVNDVSTRLGFKFALNDADIDTIWDMCRYDQAWDLSKLSPFCAAFTPKQVEILEYKEDIKYYYKSGYGSPINSNIACSAVADMLKHLDLNETANPDVVAYFSHSSMINTFLVALGAFKDSYALRANNYLDAIHRKWRTSLMGPFMANIVAVKYDCPNENERLKAMIFLNERPLELDFCNIGLCDWSMVKEKYKHFTETDCSKTFCEMASTGNVFTSIGLLIIVPIIYILLF